MSTSDNNPASLMARLAPASPAGEPAGEGVLRPGYIIDPRADLIWFLGLPFLAIAAALVCHRWLPLMALASIGLWITIPHHFATWLRTYGLPEDWERWRLPLIYGPLAVMAITFLGIRYAPATLLLVTLLWDHQHSLMQQYGLARIYDVKARTGGSRAARFDFWLNWILYGNMLLTAPLFVRLWGAEAYRWSLPLNTQSLVWIQNGSYALTALFLLAYLWHSVQCMRTSQPLNPIKYLFIGSSYFLWYFTSWQTDSLLAFGVAHRLMHGVQYMVFVNSYLGRKLEKNETLLRVSEHQRRWWESARVFVLKSLKSRRTVTFTALGGLYVLFYQLLLLRPLDELGFGIVNFMGVGPQPRPGMSDVSRASAYDLFAITLIQALPVTHYYFDSFIWKVRDAKVQQGL
jgi:hypothetical protein